MVGAETAAEEPVSAQSLLEEKRQMQEELK
jgi:hypothetical protein